MTMAIAQYVALLMPLVAFRGMPSDVGMLLQVAENHGCTTSTEAAGTCSCVWLKRHRDALTRCVGQGTGPINTVWCVLQVSDTPAMQPRRGVKQVA